MAQRRRLAMWTTSVNFFCCVWVPCMSFACCIMEDNSSNIRAKRDDVHVNIRANQMESLSSPLQICRATQFVGSGRPSQKSHCSVASGWSRSSRLEADTRAFGVRFKGEVAVVAVVLYSLDNSGETAVGLMGHCCCFFKRLKLCRGNSLVPRA